MILIVNRNCNSSTRSGVCLDMSFSLLLYSSRLRGTKPTFTNTGSTRNADAPIPHSLNLWTTFTRESHFLTLPRAHQALGLMRPRQLPQPTLADTNSNKATQLLHECPCLDIYFVWIGMVSSSIPRPSRLVATRAPLLQRRCPWFRRNRWDGSSFCDRLSATVSPGGILRLVPRLDIFTQVGIDSS